MAYRDANYAAFYVAEPFIESNLGAYTAKDFCYYQTLKMWKGKDPSFPFIDAHDKTYSVRDDSDWEKTLKPRLHERLRDSKNVILFLSSNTRNSRALHEEIDYAINSLGLPIIVVYPELTYKFEIHSDTGFTSQVENLWNRLPIFRDNMSKVPILHVPMDKYWITKALNDPDLKVFTKATAGQYYYK